MGITKLQSKQFHLFNWKFGIKIPKVILYKAKPKPSFWKFALYSKKSPKYENKTLRFCFRFSLFVCLFYYCCFWLCFCCCCYCWCCLCLFVCFVVVVVCFSLTFLFCSCCCILFLLLFVCFVCLCVVVGVAAAIVFYKSSPFDTQ